MTISKCVCVGGTASEGEGVMHGDAVGRCQ